MRRNFLVFLAAAAALPLSAQMRFDLDDLASKAKESVDISLNESMLKLAGGFLSGKKDGDPNTQKLISGLKNITVKSYTFGEEGQYKLSQLDPIRAQLVSARWTKMIGVQEKGEMTEVYSKSEDGQIAGLAVLAAEPKELTVVYIEGNINLSKLADLAGHFGIPDLPIPGAKSEQNPKPEQKRKGNDQ